MRPETTALLLFVAAAALVAAPDARTAPAPRRAAALHHVERDPVASASGKSIGSPNEGHLVGGVQLEPRSYLRILPGHENRWGLPELVHMLDRSAKRVDGRFPGSVLGVGDLSRRGGGDVSGHHSHESGRDADVGFYFVDVAGRPQQEGRLATVDEEGRVVESWLTDREARINRIFVADHLRTRLLSYARRARVPTSLRARAAAVMLQPRGATHDDHFHVRIGCPRSQHGTCLEYVTREQRTQAHRKVATKRAPVLAKARKRSGTTGAKAPPMAGVVAAADDFGDRDADAREVADQVDDEGEPRVAR